ncbi:histidine kinase [Geodermatophilus sp. CPCC 205761]|uniref:histidine kinase n=1 Tax=Geodermatophilus sp. CPCC 205761 TaxID=2936597 RepID=UPI003EED20E4
MASSSVPEHTRRHVVVLAVALAVPVAWLVVSTGACLSDGSLVYPEGSGSWGDSVPVRRVYGDSTLRQDDRIIAVDGIPLQRWVSGGGTHDTRHPGETVNYVLQRDGTRQDRAVLLTEYPLLEAVRANIVVASAPLVMLMVAGFVYWHRPREPAARLMLAGAVLLPLYATAWPVGLQVIDLAGGCGPWRYIVADLAAAAMWAVLLHLALVFPDPHPAVAISRWVPWVAYLVPPLLYAAQLALTLPAAGDPLARLERLLLVSAPSALVIPALVAGFLVAGYRRCKDPAIRRPLQWIYVSFLLALVLYVGLGQVPDWLGGEPLLDWRWVVPLLLPMPVALGAAVLRYRLLDIQVIVRRSAVYVTLTTALFSLSLAAVAVLTMALPGQEIARRPELAVFIASLVTVLCINPLHRWLHRTVSRLLFGARHDPFEVVSRLEGLSTASRPEQVVTDAVHDLATSLRLPYVELRLQHPNGGPETVVRYGEPQQQPLELPLQRAGASVGKLLLGVGRSQEPFGPADRRLLEAVSAEFSGVAHTALLVHALQASRERLVLAREEERRRLRRDLHDGIGPTLAATLMQLQAARATQGESESLPELTTLETGIRQALADLRVIVDNLRPPSLDELGLVDAIRERASGFASKSPRVDAAHRPRVEVHAEGLLTSLPAAVEVAAFRIAVEAVTNAARHSGATHIEVRLRGNGFVDLKVRDNGTGPAPSSFTSGVGLQSMADRAAELGGMCTVTHDETGGTVVHALLPLSPTVTDAPLPTQGTPS